MSGAADRNPDVDDGAVTAAPAPRELSEAGHARVVLQIEPDLEATVEAAAMRDELARCRDLAALARDQAADARDLVTAQADTAAERFDRAGANPGPDVVERAVAQRLDAARLREQAAHHRRMAAAERQGAAADREEAAHERLRARADRDAFVAELRRQHELRAAALRHQHRAETLARTLQRSLSPPRLPSIAGIDVAVHYEPSAPEEVGGDFYDLFPLAPGRSGFFLGDVCGKGPDAASVTSLARYTMRTAAMLHERPGEILRDLNAALLMDADGSMQTCTAVYGEIRMDIDATITLAVAGHPPPMVVRSHGTVEMTPAHGTLLGLVEDPVFDACEVILAPGDAIVMFSDGLHDTEIDGIRMDEPRLAELLAGLADAGPEVLVARLTSAVRGVGRPLRDDVAIMALRRTPADSG